MRTELISRPGHPERPDEDFASITLPGAGHGGTLVVLDGVTAPAGDTGCLHSVPWFTARLGGALTELALSLADAPLGEALSHAVARTAAAHADTCDLSHARTPQATVVCARWSRETVEYLVLCDSVLLVEAPDGTVTTVRDDRLAGSGITARTTEEEIDTRLRNREGGFFTAAADPGVASRAVTGTLPRHEVRSLTALTDGAARLVEVFGEGSWAACPGLVRSEGARALVDRVRDLERAAASRGAPGPGKTHDDATVVYAEV
ncbi:hypothetical protein AAH978_02930 [Streptomyces sp. ZYX-F-203]